MKGLGIEHIIVVILMVAALYDVLFINGGQPAVALATTGFQGAGGILARLTGQTPPQGF